MAGATSLGGEGERVPDTRIRDARAGDASVRGRLLDSYRNYLRVLARASLDPRLAVKVDASDLVQETLLKANERFGQFQGTGEAELLAWMRRILTRTLLDTVRRFRDGARRDLARERSLDASVEQSSQNLARLLSGGASSPSVVAQRREMSVVLSDALAELAPDHRDVIVLRSLRELGWKDVGLQIGRGPDAARKLWTRALAQLRPLIEERL